MNLIRVFEYERLLLGPDFSQEQLDKLAQYNDSCGGKYFKLIYGGIQFQQYVGVIQVGNLTIEILPKIGKAAAAGTQKDKWQQVLLDMLQECSWMNVHATSKASLRFRNNSILEAYFELFLRECEMLLHRGLIKKYRQEEKNIYALKGKLLFSKNLQHNIIHQERFFTRHQTYDQNNVYNQLLVKALRLIPSLSKSHFLNDRVYNLLFSFPETDTIQPDAAVFSRLTFDRKTAVYKEAIEIAAMIILNFRPDVSAGNNHVLAILFDMNDLWEEYVFRQLVRHAQKGMQIEPQVYRKVWVRGLPKKVSKGVKPDIVIQSKEKTLIIDTKWKLPEDDIPADADLKQMFMYNEYWEKANAVLLYPKELGESTFDSGFFVSAGAFIINENSHRHACGIFKASVLDESGTRLNIEFGKDLITHLEGVKLL